MITEQSASALELYEMYQQGVLALSGGVLEQPAKYLKMMKIINNQVKNV